jgi:importin subunit alpha-1
MLIDQGAIPGFMSLLKSGDDKGKEQAVWGLGNIAGDFRDRVLAAGALEPLLELCRPDAAKSMLRICVWTLSSFCRGQLNTGEVEKFEKCRMGQLTGYCSCTPSNSQHSGKPQPQWDVVKDVLPVLARLINDLDFEVLADVCWSLSFLSDDSSPQNFRIQAVIDSGVVRSVTELSVHTERRGHAACLTDSGSQLC